MLDLYEMTVACYSHYQKKKKNFFLYLNSNAKDKELKNINNTFNGLNRFKIIN
jgi:hypothetical protein